MVDPEIDPGSPLLNINTFILIQNIGAIVILIYIYISTKIKHNIPIEQLLLFLKASCLKINLKINGNSITILATYRSPKTNINRFLAELSNVTTASSIDKNCN